MTLILTLVNKTGIYQSSDYALTDPQTSRPLSDEAGDKQAIAIYAKFTIALAFTGVAMVGAAKTIDWIKSVLATLNPLESSPGDAVLALEQRCNQEVRRWRPAGALTIVATLIATNGTRSSVEISNADWRKRPPVALSKFRTTWHRPTKPWHLVSGYRDCVTQFERHTLQSLARDRALSSADILDEMARLNALAASRSSGWISERCWTTALMLTSSGTQGHAVHQQGAQSNVSQLLWGIDITKELKRIGVQGQMVQSSFATGRDTTSVTTPPVDTGGTRYK